MIKAILFDFGGVYFDSPFSIIEAVAEEQGMDYAVLKEIVFGSYHEDGDHPWHRLERGEITLEQTREEVLEIGKKRGLETDIYVMFARFVEVDRSLRTALADKTLEWKERGFKLAMITNNLKEFSSWRDKLPFDTDTVYDAIADSCELGYRKPDLRMYQYVLDELGLKGEETLFLDDYPENIEAAAELGINGFIVEKDITSAIEWVDQQLTKQGS